MMYPAAHVYCALSRVYDAFDKGKFDSTISGVKVCESSGNFYGFTFTPSEHMTITFNTEYMHIVIDAEECFNDRIPTSNGSAAWNGFVVALHRALLNYYTRFDDFDFSIDYEIPLGKTLVTILEDRNILKKVVKTNWVLSPK